MNFAILCTIFFAGEALGLPVVDPGVFIIQGISSCANGTGYCMMGTDCTSDIDFMASTPGQHCDGLAEAFNPPVTFSCCQFNANGKSTSEAPTTEVDPFTITSPTLDFEEIPVDDYYNQAPVDNMDGDMVEIVGVATDVTGIIGLITKPMVTTTTTTPAPVEIKSNSSHHTFSLIGLFNRLTGIENVLNLPEVEIPGVQEEMKGTYTNATPICNTDTYTNATVKDGSDHRLTLQYKDQENTDHLPIIPISHLSFSVS